MLSHAPLLFLMQTRVEAAEADLKLRQEDLGRSRYEPWKLQLYMQIHTVLGLNGISSLFDAILMALQPEFW